MPQPVWATTRLRIRQLARFIARTLLIVFILVVAALPVPLPFLALVLKRDPRNQSAETVHRKKRR